jgi:hypothetical protein
MRIFILSIFCVFSFSQEAIAFCPPFSALKREIAFCEDNFFLGNQALSCLEQYTKHVKSGQERVRRTLLAELAKMQNQQSGNFNTADASYQKAQRELERLIAAGNQAKLAVDGYLAELYFPEDWDEPSVLGQSSEDYLNSTPCFASSKRAITTASSLIAGMISDLQKTNLVAGSKQQSSAGYSDKVQVLDKRQPLQRTRIQGKEQGKDKNKSGISGTTDPRDSKK